MDFDEIVVKDSPGLCRCCLSEGCYKDLSTEYTWMGDNEVYADMLLECFDISITQHSDGPNGPNRLICEVCITRLRDACNFKKQVLESEKKFVDMLGRGDFKPKAVIIYQAGMLKTEPDSEPLPGPSEEEVDAEYLDEDLDFGDDEFRPDETLESLEEEDITVSTLPVKGKRGRKSKAVKSEKKSKITKISTDEAKPSKSKDGRKIGKRLTDLVRLRNARRNIILLLQYSNVTPFQWLTKGFKCFYCGKHMANIETLLDHTKKKHGMPDLPNVIPKRVKSKDIPIKVDVADIACKVCVEPVGNLDGLIDHVVNVHDEKYADASGECAIPFRLSDQEVKCIVCEVDFDSFAGLVTHMFKQHSRHSFVCQICGTSFIDVTRVERHIQIAHVGFRCVICDKTFNAYHKLDRHKERIHGKTRSYVCSLCSESFQSDYQLKVHMGKDHNVEKYRIKCDFCPKITTTKGAMLLHVQSLHSDPQYQCDMCNYKSAIKWMLKLHKRKHFGEKNYACSFCERHFGRSSNLRAHMKVHTGSVGRVCRWCRRGFADAEMLEAHNKEAHYYTQYN